MRTAQIQLARTMLYIIILYSLFGWWKSIVSSKHRHEWWKSVVSSKHRHGRWKSIVSSKHRHGRWKSIVSSKHCHSLFFVWVDECSGHIIWIKCEANMMAHTLAKILLPINLHVVYFPNNLPFPFEEAWFRDFRCIFVYVKMRNSNLAKKKKKVMMSFRCK